MPPRSPKNSAGNHRSQAWKKRAQLLYIKNFYLAKRITRLEEEIKQSKMLPWYKRLWKFIKGIFSTKNKQV